MSGVNCRVLSRSIGRGGVAWATVNLAPSVDSWSLKGDTASLNKTERKKRVHDIRVLTSMFRGFQIFSTCHCRKLDKWWFPSDNVVGISISTAL
ncbi:hypothetical protein AVEN_228876-1 [Araneus ventricosus]|uniref:Uncharacterized protein n=1 Tax=Araneus ventricosus TaxID=182803 RepID=A0A4Y2UD39_ARAVE|nr:hypothetical protein AVEN_228876-1 [Araneus ventricosus]